MLALQTPPGRPMRIGRIAIPIVLWLAVPAVAADLQFETASAFDRYVRATETELERLDPFLRIDGIAEIERAAALAAVRRGETYIERLTTFEAGKKIDVPNGLIHHWVGVVFVPG